MTFSKRFLCKLGSLALVASAVSALVAPTAALAQAYPNKTVSIVVGYPAGGDTDAIARLFAEKLAAKFGQPFVVENRIGASGTIANAYVAKANPDGYTLLLTPNTITTALAVLKPGTGAQYDTVADFTPLFLIGTQPLYFVVNTSTGIKNMKELVEASKTDKVKVYGSPGSGSPMHLLGEMFNKSAGTKLVQTPYRGTAPSVIDLVGGHIPMILTTLGPVSQHIATGKLAAIGVADAKRSVLSPDVATLQEQGIKDADLGAWQGFMGPKGMSPDIVRTLNTAMNDILKAPDVLARLKTAAAIPVGGDAASFARLHTSDFNKYGALVKELKIQAD